MKATITRPDGTRIEAEGTPEEIARLSWPLYPNPWPLQPIFSVQPIFNNACAGVANMGGQVWVSEIGAAAAAPLKMTARLPSAACAANQAGTFVVTH